MEQEHTDISKITHENASDLIASNILMVSLDILGDKPEYPFPGMEELRDSFRRLHKTFDIDLEQLSIAFDLDQNE